MIEYIVNPCRTGAAYEIIVKKGEIKKIMNKIEDMEEFIIVKNEFITILKIENLHITVLDRGKIIFRGEKKEDVVRKRFNDLFM